MGHFGTSGRMDIAVNILHRRLYDESDVAWRLYDTQKQVYVIYHYKRDEKENDQMSVYVIM